MFSSLIVRLFGEKRTVGWYQFFSRKSRMHLGAYNSARLAQNLNKLRRVPRIAVDTQLLQLANFERPTWYTEEWKLGPETHTHSFLGPYIPEFSQDLILQVPFLYSILELARNDQIELVVLPTVAAEKKKAPNKFNSGMLCRPLDHDVKYTTVDFGCSRLTHSRGSSWPIGPVVDRDRDECRFELGKYNRIYRHISGKSQRGDVWHFTFCDAYGLDVFLTADEKFLKPYRQIQKKLHEDGVRARALNPRELCGECNLWPTNPAAPDYKTFFHEDQR